MKFGCLSDTHLLKQEEIEVPIVDALFHSGDGLNGGHLWELKYFAKWFSSLPANYHIFVPGNHDRCLDPESINYDAGAYEILEDHHITLLIDKGITVEGIKIYGSPWVVPYGPWGFGRSEAQRLEKFEKIPEGLDILITHSPPRGILDRHHEFGNLGCPVLREIVFKKKPKIHIFGHIHDSGGNYHVENDIKFFNCANLNEKYRYAHPPRVLEVRPKEENEAN